MRRILLLLAVIQFMSPVLALAEEEEVRFYAPAWADSSGKDGKGGVSITCSEGKNNIVLRKDPCPARIESKIPTDRPDWVVFDSDEDNNSLSYEFTWITKPSDKFWSRTWAGGGIAFNKSWNSIDITGAKFLVFYAKTSQPGAMDFELALTGDKDGEQTGPVLISDYAEDKKIGSDWTKVAIPIDAMPNLSKIDKTKVKTININLKMKDCPENKPLFMRFNRVYFSDSNLVTPVENLGWLKTPEGVEVIWDKTNDEGIVKYLVMVDGKAAGRVEGASKRRVKIPTKLLPPVKPHVVGIAAANDKQVLSYQAVTVTLGGSQAQAATVTVSDKLGRSISPYLYGQNGWGFSPETYKKLGTTVSRWGGNATTTYNWKDDAENRGGDWFFLNTNESPKLDAEKDKSYYKFIEEVAKGGAQVIMTIPTIGWVAKRCPEGVHLSSYPLSLFPKQDKDDQGAGSGFLPGGKEPIWGNDPNNNYLKSDPEFQKGWVETIVKNFGTASQGGVKFYNMDNEPGLWHWNHRDVCPLGIGYDDLVDLNAKYAAAVKSVDKDAQILGMVAWGAMELAGSNWDFIPGGKENYKRKDEKDLKGEKWTERKAHGDVPQVIYFLREMKKRSDEAGVRLLDYLDNHGFPEVWGKNAQGEKMNVMGDLPYDPVMTPKQFDGLRVLWDDTFVSQDSWCYDSGNAPYFWTPWVGLIPKLKKYIDENFPGTKLAMTEYYPASSSYYHGGLLVAVETGIFMREGMDLACDWGSTHEGNYVYLGHKLFSNYDDKGSKVGGNYVDSTSSFADLYSFAAKDASKTYVALINKNHDQEIETTVNLPAAAKTYHTYTLSESSGKRLYDSGEQAAKGSTLSIQVPAFSAVLVVAQ